MSYYTYILYSPGSGHYYIGQTSDIERRLSEHNDLTNEGYTRRHQPWVLLTSIEFFSRLSAVGAERYLKRKPRDFISRLTTDEDLRLFIKSKFEVNP